MRDLLVTSEHYKEFTSTVLWQDIKNYCQECIEFNRDFLDDTRKQVEGFEESSDMLRGRNRALRDFMSYVEKMAEDDII